MRIGTRQTADRVVSRTGHSGKRVLLVTGANGFLGRHLITSLAESSGFRIWAYGRDKDQARIACRNAEVEYIDQEDLSRPTYSLGLVDTLVHLGFARPHYSQAEIAKSLIFTSELFTDAAMHQVPRIIHISSQGVYGQSTPPPWDESTPPAPHLVYGQAKLACEMVLRSIKSQNPHLAVTSLRLSGLSGGQIGILPQELLYKLTGNAMRGEPIIIHGGNQVVERMDVRDAVSAIALLLQLDSHLWNEMYCLGSNQVVDILSAARMVSERTSTRTGRAAVAIQQLPGDIPLIAGMNTDLFMQATGWKPQFWIGEIIDSIIDWYLGHPTSPGSESEVI
jgi:nucleoside-diphosphate-sugar epimerase